MTLKEQAEQIDARIKDGHSRHCSNWETWVEHNMLTNEGRRDVTFEGCRTCRVAIARY